MTRKEYLEWVEKENIDLRLLNIVIGKFDPGPFYAGVYQEEDGDWTYYWMGERFDAYKETGTEEQAFYKLKGYTEVKLGELEYLNKHDN